MPKGYTTKERLENYLLQSIDPSFDAQIEEWIEAVELFIEKMTGRVFISTDGSGPDSEKVFDGYGSRKLLIDDATEISIVEINDTVQDADTYVLYPANAKPKTRIELRGGNFPHGQQNIKVTGRWGYSDDVPMDVMLAATILVSGLINASRGIKHSNLRSETIGRYSVTYGSDQGWKDYEQAVGILSAYKKFEEF